MLLPGLFWGALEWGTLRCPMSNVLPEVKAAMSRVASRAGMGASQQSVTRARLSGWSLHVGTRATGDDHLLGDVHPESGSSHGCCSCWSLPCLEATVATARLMDVCTAAQGLSACGGCGTGELQTLTRVDMKEPEGGSRGSGVIPPRALGSRRPWEGGPALPWSHGTALTLPSYPFTERQPLAGVWRCEGPQSMAA